LLICGVREDSASRYFVTVSVNDPTSVVPPPLTLSVIVVDLPTTAVEAAVNLTVLVCGPVPESVAGVNVQVTPAGSPVADRFNAELNPGAMLAVRFAVTKAPAFTDAAPVDSAAVNGRVTVRISVCVRVIPPPEAVTVTVAAFKEAVGAAVKVSVLEPVPGEGNDADVKAAVTPAGRPLTESVTAPPGLPPTLTPTLAEPPCATLAAEAARLNVKVGGVVTGAGMVTLTVAALVSELPEPLTVTL